ncbi:MULTISPECIES: MlaC/ttg2D family ABC transporter substrate-binding protein [unclassified Pseudoalteromonas]|uniref:MlaC/ttg2D family ABC transporter substrate-binding protein n=1 Tax=unclassified Pseudoalteromonas TaxID=194690 RepID=UPI0003F97935|nr:MULTISPECIES: ABC transporter substrate-binding protein [unclassified Pseudoalteromonas]MDC9499128.1 ABC transporter substrate-binding protein [Pseudoalteromonas sp. Angola-20]MDC9518756.1 ABC transporter substrate-binding protein [Pseudoalteromonas sp. Angola-22]MDC9535163.1 ABC transporter substrate-binding protein [Pseudoalteromonas sp. Angola-9]MDC9565275.1 ABC transporter substrate-binding protein [Pseudoalteromonas sp. GAB2316C]MDC9569608.1 ABC transporter substrate-binding protein [P
MKLFNTIFIAAAFFSSALFAQTAQSPQNMLEGVADTLFSDIAKVNAQGDASKADMARIVETRLMPNIDIKFVSFKLLGKHIKGIEREQAVRFIDAVEHYLTGTYAGALMKYTGQQVVFEQDTAKSDSEYATVKTQIIEPNAPVIDLHFKLRQGKDQQWKVYDIVAEGISLLSAKQKEIIQRISDVGLEQVITELKNK